MMMISYKPRSWLRGFKCKHFWWSATISGAGITHHFFLFTTFYLPITYYPIAPLWTNNQTWPVQCHLTEQFIKLHEWLSNNGLVLCQLRLCHLDEFRVWGLESSVWESPVSYYAGEYVYVANITCTVESTWTNPRAWSIQSEVREFRPSRAPLNGTWSLRR